METLLIERNNRIFFANAAKVVRSGDDLTEDNASLWEPDKANPYIKWIAGDFVEADNPNSNKQFWTKDDLELSQYSIRFAPLNMLHKQRQPVGFFASTRTVDLKRDEAAKGGSLKIEALSGLWSHIFPFESALIDQADGAGSLFYSMECRGSHLICAGDAGCGEKFEYMAPETHCAHLMERSSIRHIVNPTFRGGAIIIPPVKPGWKDARASVYRDAIRDEASKYAEMTEAAFNQANAEGREITAAAWEHLMASIISLGSV